MVTDTVIISNTEMKSLNLLSDENKLLKYNIRNKRFSSHDGDVGAIKTRLHPRALNRGGDAGDKFPRETIKNWSPLVSETVTAGLNRLLPAGQLGMFSRREKMKSPQLQKGADPKGRSSEFKSTENK